MNLYIFGGAFFVGIKRYIKRIRHWYSQEQLRNGVDVCSLSRLLGHENITITKRYLQSIKDEDIIDLSLKTSPLMNVKKGGR